MNGGLHEASRGHHRARERSHDLWVARGFVVVEDRDLSDRHRVVLQVVLRAVLCLGPVGDDRDDGRVSIRMMAMMMMAAMMMMITR